MKHLRYIRGWRYPLWALFALTAIVAAAVSWLATMREKCCEEQQLAQSLGFDCVYDDRLDVGLRMDPTYLDCRNRVVLEYRGPAFLDRFLGARSEFQSVTSITISEEPAGRELLEALPRFAHLESLAIFSRCPSEDSLAVLKDLGQLRELSISREAAGPGLGEYIRHCDQLRVLDVEGIEVDSRFFEALGDMKHLRALILEDCDIDEPSLLQFAEATSSSLETIDLSWSGVSQETQERLGAIIEARAR